MALCVIALAARADARPVDLSAPGGNFGSANAEGYLRYFVDLGMIEVAGIELPLRLDFSSKRDSVSPYGGKSFSCGLMESKAILIREKMLRVDLPCSKALYMRRSDSVPSVFRTMDGEWKGQMMDDLFALWRDDGWKLVYRDGKIVEMTTDKGRVITWAYSGGVPFQLKEGGNVVFEAKIVNGEPIQELVSGAKRWTLSYANRPRLISIQGQTLVEGFDQALEKVVLPDGMHTGFEFGLTDKKVPYVVVAKSGAPARTFTWDQSTRFLLSDGEWDYTIKKDGEPRSRPQITRVNSKGQKEYYFDDVVKGVTTCQTADGVTSKVYRILSPGLLYGQVTRKEKTLNDKLISATKRVFDEKGRVIRETDEAGQVFTLSYDEKGTLKERRILGQRDEEILAALKAKEEVLIKAVSMAPSKRSKDEALQKLAFFYIHDAKWAAKAEGLMSQFTNKRFRYASLVQQIYYRDDTTPDQKIAELMSLEKEFPGEADFIEGLVVQLKDQKSF